MSNFAIIAVAPLYAHSLRRRLTILITTTILLANRLNTLLTVIIFSTRTHCLL
jgi:hypothetical protein